MNFGTYLDEIRFAFGATPDWRSRMALLNATARFHMHNFSRGKNSDRSPVDIDLKIGETTRNISVRPFAGDIFVLYEVLAAETYKVPAEVIDPVLVKTIVDCGANVGMTALYLAGRHPNAKIISIEPDPVNFAQLQRNTRSEPRIVPVQAALVGTKSRPVVLTQDRPAWGNSVADASFGAAAGIEVQGLTLADLCSIHGLKWIDLLKVDIEGAEEEMFANPEFLSLVSYLMIELHGDYTLERFRQDVAPMGFEVRLPVEGERPRTVTAFPARSAAVSN